MLDEIRLQSFNVISGRNIFVPNLIMLAFINSLNTYQEQAQTTFVGVQLILAHLQFPDTCYLFFRLLDKSTAEET
jgi:hypothetical protein